MKTFINLHHHDNFSLRCALGSIDDAIKKIKEYNQPTLAVTNYNELSGWVQQYFSCRKNEIKPILAVQMMVSNYRVFYKENSKLIDHIDFCGANKQQSFKLQEMTEEQKVSVGVNWHLLLYAKNEEGYYNIIKIHNDAQLHGVYEHPRTTNYFLSQHSKGIICVIPSVNGEVINDIENDREKFALVKYKGYKKIFDEVYLELTIAEDDYYIEENNKVIQFAKKYNIPLVIGINSHYINKDDESTLKALMSIKKNGDVRKEVNVCSNMSFKSTEEVYELFQKKFKNDIFTMQIFEQALNNNHKLVDSIEDFELNTDIKMPKYPNAEKVLREKAWEGLRNRGKADDPRYVQRLNYELDNVIKAGFADYFLFLEDVCRYCHENGIKTGTGRGSGGGCIVLYALHIFEVDPVKYNLLFERFLDANRLNEIVNKGGKVSGCFSGDTYVKMINGYKQIKDICVNDIVLGDDNKYYNVENIFCHGKQELFNYYYKFNGKIYFITCTKGHIVKTIKKDLIIEDKIGNLYIGDVLIDNNLSKKEIIKVQKTFQQQVYDLQIKDNHHYVVCGKRYNKRLLFKQDIKYIRQFIKITNTKSQRVKKLFEQNKELKNRLEQFLIRYPYYLNIYNIVYCIVSKRHLPKCKNCSNKINYNSYFQNKKYCSCKCASINQRTVEKRKETCLKKYNIDSVSKVKQFREMAEITNLEKYGNKCFFATQIGKQKIKETQMLKYGVSHHLKLDQIKEKQEQTNLKKYGVKCVLRNDEILQKTKQKNIQIYGYENPSMSKIIREKVKNTVLSRYGVEYIMQNKQILSKNIKSRLKYVYQKNIERWKQFVQPMFDIQQFSGWKNKKIYRWKCIKCGNQFETHYTTNNVFQGRIPRCLNCYPICEQCISNLQKNLLQFVKSICNQIVLQNDRKIIKPYQLDIYIPSKNIAIQFDGLVWHSDKFATDKNYHLMKTEMCLQKGIQLLHIFEDEWLYKPEIVKDRIKNILGIYDNRIYARKCIIKEIQPSVCKQFLDINHIQGHDNSKIRLGLFYQNQLISVMTFAKPRFNKNYEYELVRFASKLGYQVIGGASKLLKYFQKNYHPKNIISYADRRYSNGKLYYALGFQFLNNSEPNYWWCKSGNKLSRYQCQKHKLKKILGYKFNPKLTQVENMYLNSFNRIYDCGNIIFYKEVLI